MAGKRWFSRRRVFILSALLIALLVPAGASAFTLAAEMSTGYRQDRLDWNIAGDLDGANPNVLSELTWRDLESWQVGSVVDLSWPLAAGRSIVAEGEFGYGWVMAGRNRDSDYAADNRTQEFSRSDNDAGDGYFLDLVGGAGIRFELPNRWCLTPLLGYAYFRQHLVIRDGVQTVSVNTPPYPAPPAVGTRFPDLDSSYRAWWWGPWLGGEVAYRLDEKVNVSLVTRWHLVELFAEANWNLRSDLEHPVSFEHEADGSGITLKALLDYEISERWQAGSLFEYRDFKVDDGLDVVYFSSGTVGGTRLNEVNWESWTLSLFGRYSF